MSGQGRSTASLMAELGQLREALENAHRRLDLLRERLRQLTGEAGQAAVVEVTGKRQAKRRPHAAPGALWPRPPEARWPASRPEPRPLEATPGLAHLTLTGRGLPAVGFSICGFSRGELERLVALVAAKQAADRNFVPVFLTDIMAPEVFRRHRYVFEYFPAPGSARGLAGTESWEDYARRRLVLIKRKYALTQIVTFGKQPFCSE